MVERNGKMGDRSIVVLILTMRLGLGNKHGPGIARRSEGGIPEFGYSCAAAERDKHR